MKWNAPVVATQICDSRNSDPRIPASIFSPELNQFWSALTRRGRLYIPGFCLLTEINFIVAFQNERKVIILKVFLLILNQAEFCLDNVMNENCHYGYIPFNLKETEIKYCECIIFCIISRVGIQSRVRVQLRCIFFFFFWQERLVQNNCCCYHRKFKPFKGILPSIAGQLIIVTSHDGGMK